MVNISLRKIKKTDLKYFLIWWKDEELIRLTSGIREESDKVLAGYFSDILKTRKHHHYIILKNDKVIGHIAIIHKNRSTFEMQVIIGRRIDRGHGYGELAIKKALAVAFIKLGYSKAYIEVRPNNKRAIRAYRLCGFQAKGLKKYPRNKFQPVVMKMELSKQNYIEQVSGR